MRVYIDDDSFTDLVKKEIKKVLAEQMEFQITRDLFIEGVVKYLEQYPIRDIDKFLKNLNAGDKGGSRTSE